MKSILRARSYAALTIGGGGSGSGPDSPSGGADGGNSSCGPAFLTSAPPPFAATATATAAAGTSRPLRTSCCAVAVVLAGLLAVLLAVGVPGDGAGAGLRLAPPVDGETSAGAAARSWLGGAGGGGNATAAGSAAAAPSPAFAWPPQLEADNASPNRAPDPAQPSAPEGGRRLRLVLVVHRHGARTPLAFSYGNSSSAAVAAGAEPAAAASATSANNGNGSSSSSGGRPTEDAALPYSRCPGAYPGVRLEFRTLPAPPLPAAADGDSGDKSLAPLPPGAAIDEGEPVMSGDGSCRLGTLTRRGYAQAVRLGAWIRARYCVEGGEDDDGGGDGGGGQRRLRCAGRPAQEEEQRWFLYSSRLRRTVATLRGVLTGLVADSGAARELLAALEAKEEEDREEGEGGTREGRPPAAPLAPPSLEKALAAHGAFTVDQAANQASEFMYGATRSCPALAPLVAAAEAAARAADAAAAGAGARAAAAARACREILPAGAGGCGVRPALDWRRLRDVVSAMLAEQGARGLELLPLPPANRGGASAAAVAGAPGKPLLRALGDAMAYAARREARIIAPESAADRTIALGIGPLVQRLRAAIERAAAAAAAAAAAGAREPEPELAIYSGHDSTLMPLLTAIGAPRENAAWPPYASSLVFEVWGPPAAAAAAAAAAAGAAAETAGAAGQSDGAAAAAAAAAKTGGRRERAGGRAHPPVVAGSAALVRVLHDGRLMQERPAADLAAALAPFAAGDAERQAECRGAGGAAKAGRRRG